jgi:hypothetical protein
MEHTTTSWSICLECDGRGKRSQRLRKKVRLAYQLAVFLFDKSNNEGTPPVRPKAHLTLCNNCSGSGLLAATHPS